MARTRSTMRQRTDAAHVGNPRTVIPSADASTTAMAEPVAERTPQRVRNIEADEPREVRRHPLADLVMSVVFAAILAVLATQMDPRWAERLQSDVEIERSPRPSDTSPIPPPASAASDEPAVVGFGYVDVDGGTIPLTVEVPGRVVEILVREGDSVRAGEPLLRLANESALAKRAQAQAQVAEAETRLAQARRAPANHRLLVAQQDRAIRAALARHDGHERQVNKLRTLYEGKAVAEENLASARERLVELEAVLEVERLKLEQLELDVPSDSVALAEANLANARASLKLAQDLVDRHVLVAPMDGQVLRRMVAVGQTVGPIAAQPAVILCPAERRLIRCEIEQEYASRVHSGMRAVVIDDQGAGGSWSGVVERCSDWIAPRRSLLDEPLQRNDVRTLECSIALDGSADLRIGQRLRVVILQGPVADHATASR